MSNHRLLIVHPKLSDSALILSMLQSLGHRLDEVCNESAAMRLLEQATFDLVIASADPADHDCLEFLNYVHRKYPGLPVILVFPVHHHERQREAFHRGASAVLRFPVPATQLRATVAQVLGLSDVVEPSRAKATPPPSAQVPHSYQNGNGVPHPPHCPSWSHSHDARNPISFRMNATPVVSMDVPTIVGTDLSLRQTIELAGSIAPTRAPVMILGEAGSGKSLLAKSIHANGSPKDTPFIEVNCASLRESVLEVDLFGRKAVETEDPSARLGKVARAHGGTIYLAEVANLSAPLQARLVRLLQDGEIEPVGSNQALRVDVRVIVSSSQSLTALVDKGLFRQDLYYKLSVVSLRLPPLRQRLGDLEALAEHFRERFSREIGKPVVGFQPEAMDALRRHSWPGNILELENVVERAVVLSRGTWIEPCHLEIHCRDGVEVRTVTVPAPSASRTPSSATIVSLKEALEGPEKQLILDALEALNWNRQETARMLDINRTTLYKKMKKYGLLFDEPIWAN